MIFRGVPVKKITLLKICHKPPASGSHGTLFQLLFLLIPDSLARHLQLLVLLLLALVHLLLLAVDHGGEVVVLVLHQRHPLNIKPPLLLLLHQLVLEGEVLELLLLLLLQKLQVAQLLN